MRHLFSIRSPLFHFTASQLVLGLALGLTIGRNGAGESNSYSIASNVPTGGMDTSESGLKASGTYYVSAVSDVGAALRVWSSH